MFFGSERAGLRLIPVHKEDSNRVLPGGCVCVCCFDSKSFILVIVTIITGLCNGREGSLFLSVDLRWNICGDFCWGRCCVVGAFCLLFVRFFCVRVVFELVLTEMVKRFILPLLSFYFLS